MERERGTRSRRAIAADCGISESTARDWDRKYKEMGSLAFRRTRPRSAILGRKSKVTKAMCKLIVSPTRNPIRKQPYEVQIPYFKLPVQKRQLQRKLKEYTNGGGRYKCAFIKKKISQKIRRGRVMVESMRTNL